MDLTPLELSIKHIETDVAEIKAHLCGDSNHDGMILDVDRLKRSRATTNAVLWAIFVAVLGLATTAISAHLSSDRLPPVSSEVPFE